MQTKFGYLINRLLHNSNAARKEHYAFSFTADYALLISDSWPRSIGGYSGVDGPRCYSNHIQRFVYCCMHKNGINLNAICKVFLLRNSRPIRQMGKKFFEREKRAWCDYFHHSEIDSTESYCIEQWQRGWRMRVQWMAACFPNKNSSIQWDGYY